MKGKKTKTRKVRKIMPAPLVDKAKFDALLGKLINTAPLPRSEVRAQGQAPQPLMPQR
jgi:hypothetical protein